MASPHSLMRKAHSGLVLVLITVLIGVTAASVAAAPPPPSSVYGIVSSGGANVPNGTVVSAWINGVQYAATPTFTDSGLSVYTFDVPGDDDSTGAILEGGKAGDPIVFKVGGVIVPQAGVWNSGSNVQIDLTVPVATPEIATINPASGSLGATLEVAITGVNTHFVQGTSAVSFGSGVTVNSVTVSSATQLSANITIAGGATQGARTVTVTTGGEVVSEANGFTVLGPNVDVYLPAAAVGSVGSSVSIPLTTPADLTGKVILSYQFTVAFDSAVIQPTGVSTASSLSSGWAVSETHATAGTISVVGYGANPLAGSGKILDLQFTVIGAGSSSTPLTFADFRFNDHTPGDVIHNGQFTAQGLEIAGAVTYAATSTPVDGVVAALSGAGTATATSDTGGAYRLTVNSVGNYTVTPGKARYTGSAINTFDSARIAQCVLPGGAMANCPLASSDVNDNGEVSGLDAALITRYALGMLTNPSSTAGEWNFSPPSRSYSPLTTSQSGQNYSAFLRGDVNGNWADAVAGAQIEEVEVCLGGQGAATGETIELPLRVTGAAGEGIVSYQFDLRYDPALLSFVKVDADNTLTADWARAFNDAEAGLLRVGGYNATALTGDGVLLLLQFDALAAVANEQAPVIDGFQFNDSQPQVDTCVAVKNAVYLPQITQ